MTEHFVHSTKSFTVALYGPNRKPSRELPKNLAGCIEQVCLVKAAGNFDDPGYKEIVNHVSGDPNNDYFDVYADGVILTKNGSSAIMFTADCAFIALYEAVNHRLVATHAGRAAMTACFKQPDAVENIVSIAYEAVTIGVSKPQVTACIVGSICGKCFKHDRPEAKGLVEPFSNWPASILNPNNGGLDIPAIIRKQLITFGVDPGHIMHDNICTYETPNLASYRRDRSNARNAVVAVLL